MSQSKIVFDVTALTVLLQVPKGPLTSVPTPQARRGGEFEDSECETTLSWSNRDKSAEYCLLHRKAAEAAPHSKTQAKIMGENHGHVLECGSVLPLW